MVRSAIADPSFILDADMQSLCALSSSIGALVGFYISGIFVHLIGPKGMFGLLTIPTGLVFAIGIVLDETHTPDFQYKQVNQKFISAGYSMWTTLKCPIVWRPCLYMYSSLALSLNIFSETCYSRQNFFMKFSLPNYFSVVIDESVSRVIGRLKWMPLLVLSSKLHLSGIVALLKALYPHWSLGTKQHSLLLHGREIHLVCQYLQKRLHQNSLFKLRLSFRRAGWS
ncbi:hypothetical protein UlMin_004197 [Ulmus minor]